MVESLSNALVTDEQSVRKSLAGLLDAGELSRHRHHHHRHEGEKGTNSVREEEVVEKEADDDEVVLSLTPKGHQTLLDLDAVAREQTTQALTNLVRRDQELILEGLQLYTRSLRLRKTHDRSRRTTTTQTAPAAATTKKASHFPIIQAEICSGWQPGLIGRALEMHATYYTQTVGFGAYFECSLAAGLSDLVSRFGGKGNNAWTAKVDDRIIGTVFIDGEDLGGNRAHLRAFIVDSGVRGGAVGRKLLAKAIDFVDAEGFEETHLWTFEGLDAARRMYESFGFVLEKQTLGTQWGSEVMEQIFVRRFGAGAM